MKQSKHMRLPNGFGQISRINNKKLRKPYRAMVTVGKTDDGKPIVKMLKPVSYFRTYNEAYTALLEYNKDPYDLDNLMTIEQLYEKWLPEYQSKVTAGTARSVTAAWKKCDDLKDMLVKDVRSRHCKLCIESATTHTAKKNIQKLLNQMFDYAVEWDLTDRNYARSVKVGANPEESKGHKVFAEDEMTTLWENINDPTVRMIMIQCYMGWRPSELCELRSEDVNLDKWTITGGMKTEAGKERTVPIHEKIKGLVVAAKSDGGEYLFTPHLNYDTYKIRFYKVIEDLQFEPGHKPHDPRKTFVTMCKNAGVNEYAIKYMAGHAISDITEKIYTERDDEFLCKELSKV